MKTEQLELMTIKEASEWASQYLKREIGTSNISYLVQYGKIRKYGYNGSTLINLDDLRNYYNSFHGDRELSWKKKLGNDLNWHLSFDHLREKDTTKHVHRLHPYKGKFIPQLAEYFLDSHLNDYKKQIFFKSGDTILDPFMGSGTTLVQSSELELNSIGIDISGFNCMISKVKLDEYDIFKLSHTLKNGLSQTVNFSNKDFDNSFDTELKEKLNEFNKRFFPNPDFKDMVFKKEIEEEKYGKEKVKQFLKENKEFFEINGTKDKI